MKTFGMSGHTAGQPLECFVNQVVIHKTPLLDDRGNHKIDEAGNPRYLCGFRIAGGIDQDNSKSPQGYPDKGVYVTYISEGSVAEKAGLKVHDKILQVNGHDMTMVTHKKAVDYICRKAILEMFIHRPSNVKGGHFSRTDYSTETANSIANLENEMNKVNIRNSKEQRFGDFGGKGVPTDDRHGYEDFHPQPLPRSHHFSDNRSHGMSASDGGYIGYGKQFEAGRTRRQGDYPLSQQQKFPLSQGERQTLDSGRNLDNYQQQHGPLKPPRWQQYPTQHQQQQQNYPNFIPDQNRMHFDRDYNIGRTNKNTGAFESQVSRPKLSSDYKQEVNSPQLQNVSPYSSSAYQARQPQRYANDSRNPSSQQPASYHQQRSHGSGQSRQTHSSEKRSTLPTNSNFPGQGKFY